MLLLGIDLETDGLDVVNGNIIEIGAILCSSKDFAPILIYSQLVALPSGVALPQEITDITGITQELLNAYSCLPEDAFDGLEHMISNADYLVGHNSKMFDQPFLENSFKRVGRKFPGKPWIDTSVDVPYPEKMKTRKLTHLAAEHNFLNPFAHRAYADVLTMLRVLSHYDIDAIIETSKLPDILLPVCMKPWEDKAPEGKKQTDLARGRGYRWEGTTKRWLKTVKENRLDSELMHSDFQVQRVHSL